MSRPRSCKSVSNYDIMSYALLNIKLPINLEYLNAQVDMLKEHQHNYNYIKRYTKLEHRGTSLNVSDAKILDKSLKLISFNYLRILEEVDLKKEIVNYEILCAQQSWYNSQKDFIIHLESIKNLLIDIHNNSPPNVILVCDSSRDGIVHDQMLNGFIYTMSGHLNKMGLNVNVIDYGIYTAPTKTDLEEWELYIKDVEYINDSNLIIVFSTANQYVQSVEMEFKNKKVSNKPSRRGLHVNIQYQLTGRRCKKYSDTINVQTAVLYGHKKRYIEFGLYFNDNWKKYGKLDMISTDYCESIDKINAMAYNIEPQYISDSL